jgi:FKBP-type peptidyl-prolyl cis-trans isomerase
MRITTPNKLTLFSLFVSTALIILLTTQTAWAVDMSWLDTIKKTLVKKNPSTNVDANIQKSKLEAKLEETIDQMTDSMVERISADKKKAFSEYMKKHAKQENTIVVIPGMHIRIIKKGFGAIPTEKTKHITMKYSINSLTGTSYANTFLDIFSPRIELKKLQPAWRAGIMMMPVGSIWEFTFSSDLFKKNNRSNQSQKVKKVTGNYITIIKTQLLTISS